MNDDLVNRLRTQNSMLGYYDAPNIQKEAADRIEALEAALREIAGGDRISASGCNPQIMRDIARAALAGEKKDD